MDNNLEQIKEYVKSLGFDIDLESDFFKEKIEYYVNKNDIKGLIHYMSQLQNCGGYALEIPICIWPEKNYTFEEKVLRILELYPFVRLLSNEELKDNEYIVLYRAKEGGHHFIKIKDDGEAIEKNESNLPQKFNNWRGLEEAPEVAFAVLKQEYRNEAIKELPQCNRDMFLSTNAYRYTEDGYTDIIRKKAEKPKTFERILRETYNNDNSSFIYNNKTFYLKVKKDEKDLIYICDDSEILGIVCTDGDTFIIEIDDKKKNKIYGFKADIPKLIVNKEENAQGNDDLEI